MCAQMFDHLFNVQQVGKDVFYYYYYYYYFIFLGHSMLAIYF